MTRKYQVNITNTVDGSGYSSTELLECKKMTKRQMQEYITALSAKKTIPTDSCVFNVFASLNINDSLDMMLWRDYGSGKPNKSNSGGMNINLTMVNARKCSRCDCFNNIKNGKCTDKFIMEIIGKKFFANKYPDTNTKQR